MIAEVSCSHLDKFIEKVETRNLTAGIVGLGYVGLPLAQLFTSQGFKVLGLDIDQTKTEKLMRGESYIGHIPASDNPGNARGGPSCCHLRFFLVAQADTLSICVPDASRQVQAARPHRRPQYGPVPGAASPPRPT